MKFDTKEYVINYEKRLLNRKNWLFYMVPLFYTIHGCFTLHSKDMQNQAHQTITNLRFYFQLDKNYDSYYMKIIAIFLIYLLIVDGNKCLMI